MFLSLPPKTKMRLLFHYLQLLLLLLLCLFFRGAPAHYHHHHHYRRHLLHQPFFPLTTTVPPTEAPSLSPQPQPIEQQHQQPKYPFSSTPNTPQNPFFPTLPSPPPPPPLSNLATFPANISSLLFPHPPSSSSSSSFTRNHLIISLSISISLLLAAILAALSAFYVYSRRHRHHHKPTPKTTSRIESLRLFPPNTLPSDSPPTTKPPKLPPRRPGVPSSSSSEFLYIGTLANPHRDYPQKLASLTQNAGVKIGVSSSSAPPTTSSSPPYQKLGSPELKPLPPLPKHNCCTPTYRSGEVLITSTQRNDDIDTEEEEEEEGEDEKEKEEEGEDEEFYSPRGSSGRKESVASPVGVQLGRNGSSSFGGVQGESFLGSNRSLNSRTASYPISNSFSPPTNNNSASISPSRSSNTSAKGVNFGAKSPETIIGFAAPVKRSSPPSVSSSSLSSPGSSLSSPTLGRDGRGWNMQDSPSPERISSQMGFQTRFVQSVVPPPPPPPPPRFWEVNLACPERPPVLVPPSKLVSVQNVHSVPGEVQLQAIADLETNEETPKPKLKPLHWDKVKASSDRAMVWDQLKSSSFQLNEEMIETLFMVNNSNLNPKDNYLRRQSIPLTSQDSRVLDPKKSQNIAILLRALNVTIDEVCEALLEGNPDTLGTELLESLLKMAPTKEEEHKLKEFKDESPNKLGPAEKFLKAVLDIPFAFKRVDAMIYIANFDSEVEYLRRSFETLEVACGELKDSRMFLKLLEAVLKTGNRMNVGTNRGDAQAFKLDTLLKLVDVKGTDGKTTLLHFVVQEIIRSEGSRLSGSGHHVTAEETQQYAIQNDVQFRKLGLQVVSGLSRELTNVKKAAAMDSDVLSSEVAKLSAGIAKVREVLKLNEEMPLKETRRKFSESMFGFLNKAAEDIMKIQAQEKAVLSLVKEITEYFHGNSAKEEAHPFRIFTVVRDFLSILDRVCKEVGKINERTIYSSARPMPVTPTLTPVFPGLNERQNCGSSDDESPSTS